MKELEEKILKDGFVINDSIIKVDSFINHQIDIQLMKDFAQEVKEHFRNVRVDKILTIETSGLPIAFAVAEAFNNVPLVFAKKSQSAITGGENYVSEVKSFTRNIVSQIRVSKKYIIENENILIVDDFLAEGNAAMGLLDICHQGKANVVGVAVMIEKGFQSGRDRLVKQGIDVFSGAIIKAFENNKPIFE